MQTCDECLLSAFADNELDAFTHQRVLTHVLACPRCAAALDDMELAREAAASWAPKDISPLELARLHRKIDSVAAAPQPQRMNGGLGAIGLIAASILVISGTWLAALPPEPSFTSRNTASAPQPWEEMAINLQVPLPPFGADDWPEDRIRLADAGFASWMVGSLERLPR